MKRFSTASRGRTSRRGFASVIALVLAVLASVGLGSAARAWNLSDYQVPTSWPGHTYTPSPTDWRKLAVYQLMLDRFDDANPNNNTAHIYSTRYDAPADQHPTSQSRRTIGGDFKGLERNLDYIKSLGYDAIWISNPFVGTEPNGYAPASYNMLDPKLGTVQEFRELVDAIHARNMYIIVDMVGNHFANWFTDLPFDGGRTSDPTYATDGTRRYGAPFGDAIGPSNFHNHGTISDWNNSFSLERGELVGLDDLKTEDAYVRQYVIDKYVNFIKAFDIDGFRVDAIKHVNAWDWAPICSAFRSAAASIGKNNFYMFGEAFSGDHGAVGYYTGNKAGTGTKLMNGMMDYAMYQQGVPWMLFNDQWALKNWIAGMNNASYDMGQGNGTTTWTSGNLNVHFADNHDLARFLSSGDWDRMIAVTGMLTMIEGLGGTYYGSEQAFNTGGTDGRGAYPAMFDHPYQFDNAVGDNFNMTHWLYKKIARMMAARRRIGDALGYGTTLLDPQNGLFAFRRGDNAFVAINGTNTSKTATFNTGFSGTWTNLVDGTQVTGSSISVTLPKYEVGVWIRNIADPVLEPMVSEITPGHATMYGGSEVTITFDQTMDPVSTVAAASVTPSAGGTWSVTGNQLKLTGANFSTGGRYRVRVEKTATNTAGKGMYGAFQSFFTGSYSSPVVNGTQVVFNYQGGANVGLKGSFATTSGSNGVYTATYSATWGGGAKIPMVYNSTTGMWTVTLTLDPNTTFEYGFDVNGVWTNDPVNANHAANGNDRFTTGAGSPPPSETVVPVFAGLTSATDATSGNKVNLSWSAATDTSTPIKYNIYWTSDPAAQASKSYVDNTPNATTTNTTYQVSGLTNGTQYWFVVRAEDAQTGKSGPGGGNEETNLVERTATPTGLASPVVRDNVVVFAYSGGVNVTLKGSWKDTSGSAGNYRALAYDASWSNGAKFGMVQTGGVWYCTMTLPPNTTFEYGFDVNGVWTNDPLNADHATSGNDRFTTGNAPPPVSETVPPVFAGLASATDAASSGKINLSWSNATDSSGPVKYNIYWTSSSAEQASKAYVDNTPNATTQANTYQVSGLTNGTQYWFVVRAEDAQTGKSGPGGGNQETNLVELSATPTGLASPVIRANVVTFAYSGGVNVALKGSWKDTSGSNGTYNAASYDALWSNGAKLPMVQANSIWYCTVTLPPNTTFEYGFDVNGVWTNDPLNTDHATNGNDRLTTGAAAGGDTTMPSFAGLTSATDATTGGRINLSWSAASDPTTPLRYHIYWTSNSTAQQSKSYVDATPDATTTNTTYQVSGLVNGTTYYFVVRAEDGGFGGNGPNGGNLDTNLVERSASPSGSSNTTPTAQAQSVSTSQNTAKTITLVGSDPEAASLTFAIGTQPAHGTLSAITPINATSASVTYTPANNYNGADNFTFTVNDGQLTSVAATVSINVVSGQRPPIYISHLWHMHQPIYWPDEPATASEGRAEIPYSVLNIHTSRTGPYMYWPISAVENAMNAGLPNAGAQVTFTGALAENLNSYEAAGWAFGGWKNRWRQSQAWRTARNNPRLDIMQFPYFHVLQPLIGEKWTREQLELFKSMYMGTFGASAQSKGMFPTENSVSLHNIPTWVDAGIEWVIVDNVHFDRAAAGYPWGSGTNLYEVNPADVRNPNPNDWVQLSGLWAPGKISARWGHQPHYIQYVNPTTGEVKKIIAIPGSRYIGNEDARGGYGALVYEAVLSQLEPYNTDPAHPILVVMPHDGDNYGGGTEGYYGSNWSNMIGWLQANPTRFVLTTVQDYLSMYPPDQNDVIHIEPGSWSGADNGDPEYKKWLGDPGTDGYSPDWNSWMTLVAAQHRVEHAERLQPNNSNVRTAIRKIMVGQTSCYWYWDGSAPWDYLVTLASNEAVGLVSSIISGGGSDQTPPTIFLPQREPYNPGGKEWNIQKGVDLKIMSPIYDVAGLRRVELKYRVDADGVNPIHDYANELYAGGAGVGAWQTLTMTVDPFPASRSNPQPTFRANMYAATILGADLGGKLVDYYVEAEDNNGNVAKSVIQHVQWGGGSGPNPTTIWTPTNPTSNDTITITGSKAGKLHWGVNNWTPPNAVYWPVGSTAFNSQAIQSPLDGSYKIVIGPFNNGAQAVSQVNFVFAWSDGSWDNNGGLNWTINIAIDTTPPVAPTNVSANPLNGQVDLLWTASVSGDVTGYRVLRGPAVSGPYTVIANVASAASVFSDTSVSNGTTYHYVLRAYDAAGNLSDSTASVSATPSGVDVTPPVAPTGLAAVAGELLITLSWTRNNETDNDSYIIFRGNAVSGPFSELARVDSRTTSFIDSGLAANDTKYYLIRARDRAGNTSDSSVVVARAALANPPPAAPTGVIALPWNQQVTLRWNRNAEADLAGYDAWRGTAPGGPYTKLNGATLTETTWTDTNRVNGTTYYYVITAKDTAAGVSANSAECTAVPQPLIAVAFRVDMRQQSNFSVVRIGGDLFTPYWSGTHNALVQQATGIWGETFQLPVNTPLKYRYVVDGSAWEANFATASTHRELTVTDMGGGRMVVNNVFNQNGDPAPAQAAGLVGVGKSGRVDLRWSRSTEFDVVGYHLYRSQTSGANYVRIVTQTSDTAYADTAVVNFETYYYVVAAVDQAGQVGPYSAQVMVVPSSNMAPAVPSGLTAQGRNAHITLAWNANTEPDLDGYHVYRSNVQGGPYVRINADTVRVNAYTDSPLANGDTKYYVIRAVDVYDSQSAYSSEVFAAGIAPDVTPPAKPTGLAATAGDRVVSLTWNANVESDTRGYDVYRATSAAGPFTKVNAALVTTRSYNDVSVTNNITYWFYVRCVDLVGNASDSSSLVSATPMGSVGGIEERTIDGNFFDWKYTDVRGLDTHTDNNWNWWDGYDQSRDLMAVYSREGQSNYFFRVDFTDLKLGAEATNLDLYVGLDWNSTTGQAYLPDFMDAQTAQPWELCLAIYDGSTTGQKAYKPDWTTVQNAFTGVAFNASVDAVEFSIAKSVLTNLGWASGQPIRLQVWTARDGTNSGGGEVPNLPDITDAIPDQNTADGMLSGYVSTESTTGRSRYTVILHGNQSLNPGGDINKWIYDNVAVTPKGNPSGYHRALQTMEECKVPVNIHVSGSLATVIDMANTSNPNNDGPTFNQRIADFVDDDWSDGRMGHMIGGVYAEHIMPYFRDDPNIGIYINSRAQELKTQVLTSFYGLQRQPKVFWIPERVIDGQTLDNVILDRRTNTPTGYTTTLLDNLTHTYYWFGSSFAHQNEFKLLRINGVNVFQISDHYDDRKFWAEDGGAHREVRTKLLELARSTDQEQVIVVFDDWEAYAGRSFASPNEIHDGPDNFDASMKWIAQHPWVEVVTLEQLLDRNWTPVECGTNLSHPKSTYQWLLHASEGNYDNWYWGSAQEENFSAAIPLLTGNRYTTPPVLNFIPSGKRYGSIWDANTILHDAWRDIQTAPNNQLKRLAEQGYIHLIYETAWHDEDIHDKAWDPVTRAWTYPDNTWDPVSFWAYQLHGRVRHMGYLSEAARWADSVATGGQGAATVVQQKDLDLDGENEYVIKNNRVFGVFENDGGRMVLGVAYNPTVGGQVMVGPIFTNAPTEGEEEDGSRRISAFADMNENYLNALYTPTLGTDSIVFTSPDGKVRKDIRLPNGAGTIEARYIETVTGPLYIRNGLIGDLHDMTYRGERDIQLVGSTAGPFFGVRNTRTNSEVRLNFGGTTYNTNYTDGTPDKTNTPFVRATEITGNGAFTFSLTLNTDDTGVVLDTPATPSGLGATAGNQQVYLSWTAGGASAGYHVYRSTFNGGPYSKINGDTVAATNYTDTGLSNGTPYYYVVRATSNRGTLSLNSNQATATPSTPSDTPAAPTGLAAYAGNAQVILSWTATDTTLAGWSAYRATAPGGPYTKLNTSLLTQGSYTATGLSNGTRYYFTVTATSRSGLESPKSSEVSETPVLSSDVTCTLTNPTNGATVTGTVNLTATCTAPAGINRVEFFIDGALAGTATTPQSGGGTGGVFGVGNKTITIDGANTAGEWTQATRVARDNAWDHANVTNGAWATHETPFDYTDLFAAWDATYLYLGIQIVDVTDVEDPSNAGSSAGTKAAQMNLPQWVAFDVAPGGYTGVTAGGANSGEYDAWKKGQLFGGGVGVDTQVYFASNFWQGPFLIPYRNGFFPDSHTIGKQLGVFHGASSVHFAGWEILKSDGTNYLNRGHSSNRNSFFELKIPLAYLGNPDLNSRSIGIFVGHGDGTNASGVDCIPSDPATNNTHGVEVYNSPKEWADVDIFTVPFAKVGTDGGSAPTNTYQVTVNSANYADGNRVVTATAISATGATASSSVTATFANAAPPPPAPTGVAATPANGLVALSWNAVSGVAGYNVYMATVSGGPYTKVNTSGLVTGTMHSATGLTNGTTYFFVVRAVSGAGLESVNSTQVTGIPATGINVTFTVDMRGVTGVNLTQIAGDAFTPAWTPSATPLANAGSGTWTITRSFPAGTLIQYKYVRDTTTWEADFATTSKNREVTVVDQGGGVMRINNKWGVVGDPAPAAPGSLAATTGNDTVRVTWAASADFDVTHYTLHRATTQGGPYIQLGGNLAATAYLDSGLGAATRYYYVVRAVDQAGQVSSNSTELSATTGTSQPPDAPTNLSATAGVGQITLSWTASAGATGYNVYATWTGQNGVYTKINGAAVGTTSYLHTGLSAANTYTYYVKAVNASSVEGAASASVSRQPSSGGGQQPFYISYHWHQHQPIYWPYENIVTTYSTRGNYAYVRDVLAWPDRVSSYTHLPIDHVGRFSYMPNQGVQISYSGSLIENINNMAAVGDAYGNGWHNRYAEGHAWRTVNNNPRVDLVAFGYHHPLMPFTPYRDLRLQIQMHRRKQIDRFGGNYSKGMFPPESAFSTRMIPALLDEGIEWIFVDNLHLDHSNQNFPWMASEKINPPNRADAVNAPQANYITLSCQTNTAYNVSVPFSVTPHYAKWVNPNDGTERKIIIVPLERTLGYDDSYGDRTPQQRLEAMAPYNTDPNHPALIVLAHDGDNAGASGYRYYVETMGWLGGADGSRFKFTTVQDYLSMFPPNPADVVHITDGSWVGADLGDQELKKWLGDPYKSGVVNFDEGYSSDWNSWMVMVAGSNRMNHAEAISPMTGGDTLLDILNFTGSNTAKAWREFQVGYASCFWYWDGTVQWDEQATRAVNNAMVFIDPIIASAPATDPVPPTVFPLQREPYNPGAEEAFKGIQASDFRVFTFAYDVNSIAGCTLYYRIDADGFNPITDNVNEVYAQGAGVGPWVAVPMTVRAFGMPPVNQLQPAYRASVYEGWITGFSNTLLDYYVEARDGRGNVTKTEVYHVYVGNQNNGGVTGRWTPASPTQNDTITISGDKAGWLHWGVNNWTHADTVYRPGGTTIYNSQALNSALTGPNGQGKYTIVIGPFNNPAQAVTEVNFVFRYSDGSWDNNSSNNWKITITNDTTPPAQVTGLQATAGNSTVWLGWTAVNATDLAGYRVYRSASGGAYAQIGTVTSGTLYTDTTVVNGTSYSYVVRAYDRSNNLGDSSASASATPSGVDTAAPGVVTGLAASTAEYSITLSWTARTEFDLGGYRVYRSTMAGASHVLLETTSSTSRTYAGLNPADTYYFVVRAYDLAGNLGDSSVEVGARPQPNLPPSAPTNVAVSAGVAACTITWTAVSAGDLAGYNVYRATSSASAPYTKLNGAPVAGTSYNATGLTNDSTYWFVVRAVDTAGNESDSPAAVSGTPVAGITVWFRVNMTGQAGFTTVNIAGDKFTPAWAAASNAMTNEGNGIWRFSSVQPLGTAMQYKFVKDGTGWEADFPAGVSTNRDIVVANHGGGVMYVNNAWGVDGDAAPATPTNLAATAGNTQVSLSWTAVSTYDLAGYCLYRSTTPGSGYVKIVNRTTSTSFVDTSLVNGTTYYYYVTAEDSANQASTASASVSATPILVDATPPAKVAGVDAVAGAGAIAVTWTRNSENDTAGYRVYRATSASGPWTQLTTTLQTNPPYNDATAAEATAYWYVVRCQDFSGNLSDTSDPDSATLPSSGEWYDGNPANWTGTPSATSNTSTVSNREFIWTDAQTDERTDGTAPSSNYDIREFRLTGDLGHLYVLARFRDLTNAALPYIGIGVDTNRVTASGELWFGGNSDIQMDSRAAREREFIINSNRIGSFGVGAGGWTWTAMGDRTISTANDVIEARFPWSALNAPLPRTLRFTVMAGEHDGAGDAREFYQPDALDVVTNVAGNTWNEIGSDSVINFWLDVNFNADGKVNTTPTSASLVAPAANASVNAAAVNFRVSAVDVDSSVAVTPRVQIQVAADSTFSVIVTTCEYAAHSSAGCTYTFGSGGAYWWRARYADDFETTAWTDTRRVNVDFYVPAATLVSPADGAETSVTFVQFAWTQTADDLSGVDSYVLEISPRATFDTLVSVTTRDLSSYQTLTFGDTVYYWRVKTRDYAGNQAVSATRSFRVGTLVTVALSAPAAATVTNNPRPAFSWTGTADTYILQVATDPSFSAGVRVDSVNTTATSYTPVAVYYPHGTYYWRVIGRDRYGNSVTTTERLLTIDTYVAVTASSPAAGITTNGANVTFSWAGNSADTYVFQLANNPGFSPVADSRTQSAASYTPAQLPQGTWYWRVVARDIAGNAETTASRTLIVDTSVTVTLDTPSAGARLADTRPSFRWSGTGDTYRFRIARDAAFTTVIDNQLTNSTTYQPAGSYAVDTYYWTVTALDAAGNIETAAARLLVLDTPVTPLVPTNDSTPSFVTINSVYSSYAGQNAVRVTGTTLSLYAAYDTTLSQVLFQYLSSTGTAWQNCTPAAWDGTNPDTQGPVFSMVWDLTSLPDDTYCVWAKGTRGGVTDSTPAYQVIVKSTARPIITETFDSRTGTHERDQVIQKGTSDTVTLYDGTTIQIPSTALPGADTVTLEVKNYTQAPSGMTLPNPGQLLVSPAGSTYYREFTFSDGTRNFNDYVMIGIPYDESLLTIPETDIRMYYFNTTINAWSKIDSQYVDTQRNIVYCWVNHFTLFTLLGPGAASTNLGSAYAYPNPFKPYDGNASTGAPYVANVDGTGITFANVTTNVDIEVFTIAGRRISTIAARNTFGKVQWDVRNDNGQELASGVYFAILRTPGTGDRKVVKFMVVR